MNTRSNRYGPSSIAVSSIVALGGSHGTLPWGDALSRVETPAKTLTL